MLAHVICEPSRVNAFGLSGWASSHSLRESRLVAVPGIYKSRAGPRFRDSRSYTAKESSLLADSLILILKLKVFPHIRHCCPDHEPKIQIGGPSQS